MERGESDGDSRISNAERGRKDAERVNFDPESAFADMLF